MAMMMTSFAQVPAWSRAENLPVAAPQRIAADPIETEATAGGGVVFEYNRGFRERDMTAWYVCCWEG